ncbi:DUF1294 domain-containing protein [Cryobacterium tagatosivorans]|uniref:DUF1294 domain-containing protein n=1 Tax=Cryobacterium tagatosivorans TaxID=1259199 RepID=A0A4R8UHP1_9MICO|nr:cold shock and DUF1294 domain-containing protein [Cryobacterium tagatosivorans]TFB54689.1 DUF1294 domain-containing protein [Cryobacterium tagatosivorans]
MGPAVKRVEGTLTAWNDERGFGFISATHGGERTFVHIKAFAPSSARPAVGDVLSFEVELSREGKRRARRVLARGRSRGESPARPGTRRSSGPGTYLAILAFAIGYLLISLVWPLPYWVAGIYLGVSILSFIVYAADKSAARGGRRRVPESTLFFLGFAGGWPGAVVAQQVLRHKTQKASFRSVFWATVVANVAVFVVFATPLFAEFAAWTTRPL